MELQPWGAWVLMAPLLGSGITLLSQVKSGWLISLLGLGLGIGLDQLLEQQRQRNPRALPSLDRLPDLVGGLGLVGAGLLLAIGAEFK